MIIQSSNEHPTFKEVCERLGQTNNFLKYWFPDQCLAISNKHKAHARERTISKKRHAEEKTHEIVFGMLRSGKLIGNRQIETELKKHQLSILDPNIRAIVRKAKEDFLNGM
jgi:hypothetical protein